MSNTLGIVKSIGLAVDDEGRKVLRAIVDFYDGSSPDITFNTVWDRTPVKIVNVAQSSKALVGEDEGGRDG